MTFYPSIFIFVNIHILILVAIRHLLVWFETGRCLIATANNFSLKHAITKVQKTNLEMNINDTHQVLTYADDVNLIGDDIRTN